LYYESYRDKRMSWDSVVVITTRLRVGLSAKARRQETSSPKRPDRPCGPPKLLISVYWWHLPLG